MENYERILGIMQTNEAEFKRCFWHWVDRNRYFDEVEPEEWRDFGDKQKLIFYIENNELL